MLPVAVTQAFALPQGGYGSAPSGVDEGRIVQVARSRPPPALERTRILDMRARDRKLHRRRHHHISPRLRPATASPSIGRPWPNSRAAPKQRPLRPRPRRYRSKVALRSSLTSRPSPGSMTQAPPQVAWTRLVADLDFRSRPCSSSSTSGRHFLLKSVEGGATRAPPSSAASPI